MRRVVIGATAVSLALSVAACGKAGDDNDSDGGSASDSKSIGLLLPDNVTARYEKFDKPYFEAKVKELCSDCDVQYANAAADPAKQAQQMSSMVTKGVKVIVISAQDSAAIKSSIQSAVDKGVKVVAYDRLAQGPVSAYVSFDNVKVGELQGQALLDALGDKATAKSKVVMINGDDADPNAAQFKEGAHKVLDGKVDIAYEQSGLWKDTVAAQKMSAAITQLGAKNIAGVYAANDGMAGGIANTLKGAKISNIPLTGQDAELAAIQRIVAGTQSATVYKAYKPEADTAAELAVNLLEGKDIKSLADTTVTSGSGDKVPAKLLTPVSVTKDNIKDTVVKDKLYTVADICTAEYAKACKEAGLE
ncbi:substrate-binding domain-containing protein [Streptomyces ipomoeae]|uniref:D-xylose ABC transporter, periplasmic D-xylose-binding family protein n=1 Tax=Streptomyces ipomoeae 91-03 TaxID=698759 RepID=L1KT66_9ACTN|nr:substrate-binding domain-containing protein [Streptomyces ipomoeae]EKX63734.1 D-xylose ABC transporter, periplasmic D-xylose-binding family protein [Streptomyces ipomoeae 91-03]MDX2695824.1 substrate-binding domain-containing protein [Streptomyces ipomoeae]MDX2819576.1 substrate-binding domain-containing protein [Streptomyces ipomoeae]MDX2841719.1 substrate-binding domain-containing protein [Streptomyces ipomoeae]MDX2876197.1 substrate-binding domain-containing protein [Streptomyces ipomoea